MKNYCNKGFVLILSAPSGAGKSTLARKLMAGVTGIQTSVSTTTRRPRPGEREGEAYFFVDEATFKEQIQAGAFLEWAQVFGNYYGTSRQFVETALEQGQVVILDIDWQGARQVRQNMEAAGDVVGVFIMPPSKDALAVRLQSRGQDAPEVIARRMAEAADEVSHWNEYEYVVINDDLSYAELCLQKIVEVERLRLSRVAGRVADILATFDF
ncbi:MAG: guanylate kinase [Magnetococcales bacterium]|nr:guanylate kinase [Magnetococcales bacterium]